jgi:hypothetical protein
MVVIARAHEAAGVGGESAEQHRCEQERSDSLHVSIVAEGRVNGCEGVTVRDRAETIFVTDARVVALVG